MMAILWTLHWLIFIYTWIVVIACVLSFIPVNPYKNRYYYKFYMAIYSITAPVFRAVRRVLPISGAGLDFSPILIFFALNLIDKLIINLMMRGM